MSSKPRGNDNVRVVVRCRPLAKQEIAAERKRIIDMDPAYGRVFVKRAPDPTRTFDYDAVYDWRYFGTYIVIFCHAYSKYYVFGRKPLKNNGC